MSKRLKILGSILLAISFITQNYIYDTWNSKRAELDRAATDRSIIDKSVLLNEVLYFSVNLAKNEIKEQDLQSIKQQKIGEAARKLAYSSMMPIIGGKLPEKQKIDMCNALINKAGTVDNYYKYAEYIKDVNSANIASFNLPEQLKEIEKYKSIARIVYLIAYIIGSLLVIAGIALEKERI